MRAPCASLLTVTLLLAAAPLVRGAAHSEGDEQSVLVQVAPVTSGTLPQVVVAFGIVKTAPGAQHALVAHVAAMVSAVHVRPGQRVQAGDPLLELSPTPSTLAAYHAAVSAQSTAASALARMQRLVADSLATDQQLAEAEKADADARGALRALTAQGADAPSVLRAPFEAVVTAVAAAADSLVVEGAPLIDLARSDGLILLAGVAPSQAAAVKPGNPVRIEPVGADKPIEGRVTVRGALVDTGTGLVPVDISVPAHALLAGQSARASITTGEVHGFLIPHAATLVNDHGEAYLVQPHGDTAHVVPVQILASHDGQDAVSGAIDPSRPVIVAGNHQLKDGMKVRYKDEAAGLAR